ncbi:MAG: adenylate/guanylate cyclase domain-containing protein [Rhizobiaceae bacterium]
MERRLSAILAADMVGYSRLVEADEIGTFERQKVHRTELIDPTIQAFKGRIVKEMGDGLLVEFSSVLDAVNCAVKIQKEMYERETGIEDKKKIVYRIGINSGDIIVDGDDIHGDGVNIAARLEQYAEPGEICISGTAYDHLRTRIDADFQSLGELDVKNIQRKIRAYRVLVGPDQTDKPSPENQSLKTGLIRKSVGLIAALILVIAGGGVWFWLQQGVEPTESVKNAVEKLQQPSIAVLPFDNLSDDPKQVYFVDGIVEDLITDLSKLPNLFVIARNSSFAYKGKSIDLKQVSTELGVRHLLEGSVRRFGDRVRINAQLIDGQNNAHVWAERYDGNLTDIFRFQDEITLEIVKALKLILAPEQKKAISVRGTKNADAYDEFLRGMRQLAHRRNLDFEGNAKAIEAFEKALEYDPSYADAHAGLAWANWIYHTTIDVWAFRNKTAFQQAEKALTYAKNALAHRVLSKKYYSPALHIDTSDEPSRARLELLSALAIEPNNPDLLADLADVLPFAGEPLKALETIKRATRLNPDHPDWYLRPMGIAQLLTGDHDGAARSLKTWLKGETVLTDYNLWLVSALALSGQVEEAKKVLQWIHVRGSSGLPTTFYALGREWPLPEKEKEIFFEGLRMAGFPGILAGGSIRYQKQ